MKKSTKYQILACFFLFPFPILIAIIFYGIGNCPPAVFLMSFILTFCCGLAGTNERTKELDNLLDEYKYLYEELILDRNNLPIPGSDEWYTKRELLKKKDGEFQDDYQCRIPCGLVQIFEALTRVKQ